MAGDELTAGGDGDVGAGHVGARPVGARHVGAGHVGAWHRDPSGPAIPASEALAALRSLQQVTKRVHASLDLAQTLDAVAQGVVDVAGFGLAVVNLLRPDDVFEVVSAAGHPIGRAALLGNREPAADWQELLTQADRDGSLLRLHHRRHAHLMLDDAFSWVPDLPDTDDPGAWHPRDALFATLTTPTGTLLGVLSVDLPEGGRQPTAVQLELLELFADQAAIAVQHAHTYALLLDRESRAQHAAAHDDLTGLANRSRLAEVAAALTSVPDHSIAALLIDLDDFKSVNDSVGHRGGDQVLQAVARRLQRAVRTEDLVARTGGDEFVVLMQGADIAAVAAATADRLAVLLAAPVHSQLGLHRVGASIGVAVGRTPVDLDQLLAEADQAMYDTKRARNAAREPASSALQLPQA